MVFTLGKNATKTESRWNHTATDHKEGEQLEDWRNVGKNSCKSGDGIDQTGPLLDVDDYDDNFNTDQTKCYVIMHQL